VQGGLSGITERRQLRSLGGLDSLVDMLGPVVRQALGALGVSPADVAAMQGVFESARGMAMNIPAVVRVCSEMVVVRTVSISSSIVNMANPWDALLLRLAIICRCRLQRWF
jgi:hypothetical protein